MSRSASLKAYFLLAICVLLLASCMGDEEKAIQGKWANGNAHFWAEWNFNGGSYSYFYDNNFTNIYETGKYRIARTSDDYIDIELYNRQGGIQEMMDETVEMRISFKAGDVIRIQNGDYTLVYESSLKALETAKAAQGK